MNKDEIKFYTATWCGYCQNLKAFMDRSNINYYSIDIDKDPKSEKALKTVLTNNELIYLFGKKSYNIKIPTADEINA